MFTRASFAPIALMAALLAVAATKSFGQGPSADGWSGQVQCQISVQEPTSGYKDDQTQTWQLTGPAKPRNDFRDYPASWSVVGSGSKSPLGGVGLNSEKWTRGGMAADGSITIYVPVGTNNLRIAAGQKPLTQRLGIHGTTGSSPLGGVAAPQLSGDAEEWRYWLIEIKGGALLNAVSGSKMDTTTSVVGFHQPPRANVVSTCSWNLTRNGADQSSSGNQKGPRPDVLGRLGGAPAGDGAAAGAGVNAGAGRAAAGEKAAVAELTVPGGVDVTSGRSGTKTPSGSAGATPRDLSTSRPNEVATGGGLATLTEHTCTAQGPRQLRFEKLTPGGVTLLWEPAEDFNNQIRYTVSRKDLGLLTPTPVQGGVFMHSAALSYRETYQYSVTADYGNGRCGNTSVTITPPKPYPPVVSASGVQGPYGSQTGSVRLGWGVEGDLPSGYLVMGPGLPEDGVEVPQKGQQSLVVNNLQPGTHTWLMIPFWNTGTGMMRDAATAARVTVALGRYRVVVNGLRVNQETRVDQFNSDGEHDEIYVAAKVFKGDEYNPARGPRGTSLGIVKSNVHGDVSRWITRAQAGTVSNSGGLQTGDTLPWGVGDPAAHYNRPPSRDTFPLVLCECWLTEKDSVEIEATLWQANTNYFRFYEEWEQGRLRKEQAKPLNDLISWADNSRPDVPIGDVDPAHTLTVRAADVDRSSGVNLPAGTFSLRFQGSATMGGGDYEMYVRVERVP